MKIPLKQFLLVLSLVATNLLFLSCSSYQDSKGIDKVEVKAMTYNIYSNRNSSIEKISEIIRTNDPDLVSLQEVERFTDINPSDVPATFAELTGMKYHYFAHALDIKDGGDYGNVILSKYPIIEADTYKLYGVEPDDYVRSFGYIKIEKEGKSFYFATTHLDHKRDISSKMKMVHDILDIVKSLDAPVILAGDMNAQPTHKPVVTLNSWFTMECCNLKPTVPAPGSAENIIDYLMYGPEKTFEMKDYHTYYEAGGASDHYPVTATFEINF